MSTENKNWISEEDSPRLTFTRNWENSMDFPTHEVSEAQVRKDMQALHDEVKDFINDEVIADLVRLGVGEIARAPEGAGFKYIRLNRDRVFEVSDDGVIWTATSSSGGHLILNESGKTMPQRSRIKFVGSTVTDDGENLVVEYADDGSLDRHMDDHDAHPTLGPSAFAKHTWGVYSGSKPEINETPLTRVSFTTSSTSGYVHYGWAYSDSIEMKVLPSGEVRIELAGDVKIRDVYNEASTSDTKEYTDLFRGKYCTCRYWPGYIVYIPVDATFDYTTDATKYVNGNAHGSGAWRTYVDKAVLIEPTVKQLTFEQYVQNYDDGAYPKEGYQDGFWYSYRANMRTLVDHPTRLAYGSYVGTGLSGQNGTVSLSFDFAPQVLMIFSSSGTMFPGNQMVYDTTYCNVPAIGFPQALTTEFNGGLFISDSYRYGLQAKRSADGKTISWYHPYGYYNEEVDHTFYSYGEYALNDARTYYYVAIG